MSISYITPQFLNVDDFGAKGDGATNDTTAIQNAINTGKPITGTPGKTYLTGTLTVSTDNQILNFTGCTLKKTVGSGFIMRLTGDHTKVLGGTFDGNASNQGSPSDGARYGYGGISLDADHCEVAHCRFTNHVGIGLQGYNCGYCSMHDNYIEGELYGIYIADISTDRYSNRVLNNYVAATRSSARGIYITGNNDFATSIQYNWEISHNVVYGDTVNATTDAVGITCRGTNGICSNNQVFGFNIGISCDSTRRSQIVNNRVLDVNTGHKLCYEVLGEHNVIAGNYGKPKYDGIGLQMTGSIFDSLSHCAINGNVFEHSTSGNFTGIDIQVQPGEVGKYISINGNTIKTNYRAINLTRNTDGITITGNTFLGPGSSVNGSRVVFLNENPGSLIMIGNTAHAFQRVIGLYSALSKTFTADPATDFITCSGHGLTNNDPVMFTTTGTLPSGLATTSTYFVSEATTDTFKVAGTPGGATANITAVGTGTHTVVRAYSGLNVSYNDFSKDNAAVGNWLALEGFAVFGSRVFVLFNTSNSYNQFHYLDRGLNVQLQLTNSYATPEGSATAGIGSLLLSLNGGAGTTLFVKQAGTGNTGWAGK